MIVVYVTIWQKSDFFFFLLKGASAVANSKTDQPRARVSRATADSAVAMGIGLILSYRGGVVVK
jgi:hypothetical protein